MKHIKLFEAIKKAKKRTDKPTLKFKTATVIKVDWNDLENFIEHVYDLDESYSVVASLECGNDTSHEIYVDSQDIDKYHNEEMMDFMENGEDPGIQTIMNDLARKKLIPDNAEYIIRVCW